MKKELLFRCLGGALGGIVISYFIEIGVSIAIGDGNFYPCVPGLAERYGSEITAVIIQTLLSVLLGMGFAGASYIWDRDDWSLLKQTGIYFAKPGYAYIKVSTDINTSVTAYCVVEVLPGQGYTVTLDANGGTVKPDSVSVQYGMAVGQLPVPVREGYTFDGWYDENGAQYTEDTVYAIAGDATLTARWTANIYEITLDANGGVTDVALVQVTFGQAVGALPTPTREGYVFLGWFDEAGSRYDASTVYSTADGVTLTARWGQEDSTFTITLNANGGKVEPSALAVVYGQAVGALPVPTREGYTFGGWYDKDGNRYDASSVYSVKGDTTLTARWIENSVQTGDGFPIFLLSGAMMAAAAGAVMLLLKRRKLMGE